MCVSVLLLVQSTVFACGPETIDPIFVFTHSPDLPFDEFTKGKIGILQSSFGRKTLVIAHRYLGGGTYTEDEQRALVEALVGAKTHTEVIAQRLKTQDSRPKTQDLPPLFAIAN